MGECDAEGMKRVRTPLIFNTDGSNIAFGVRQGMELWWRVAATR